MKYVDFFFRKSVDTKNWQKFYTCWYDKLIVVSKKKKKSQCFFFFFFVCISSFFRCATFTIGLSTGWSELSLCPTWHQPDQIGSPKPGPAVDNSGSGGWMSAVRRVSFGFGFVEIVAKFRWNLWFLLDLTGSQWD